jgi:2-hydroxy-3-keto-5-methylthiopentenyl-1-phosphate phosphatase
MDKNRSLNDLTFERKLPIYFGENLLAKSLSSDCYLNNPQFKRFCERENLNFKEYSEFNKEALLERQELYEEISKKIWGVEQLDKQVN